MSVPPFTGSWIWLPQTGRGENRQVCFRRTFTVRPTASAARLALTADSRYQLWINGQWVGFGPVRSWPQRWSYDTYDLRPYLRPGENTLAVLVHEIGVGTFQYFDAPPGLLLQLDWTDADGPHVLASDAQWRCAQHDGYAVSVPRICCQQSWEEQFDARTAFTDWTTPDFDDAAWLHAGASAAGDAHPVLEPRDIPFLTRTPLRPAACPEAVAVKSPALLLSAEFRSRWNSASRTADQFYGEWLCGVRVYSPCRQTLTIWQHQIHGRLLFRLNGRPVEWQPSENCLKLEGSQAVATLEEGWNALLFRGETGVHLLAAVFACWTATPLWLEESDGNAWSFWGPFDPERDDRPDHDGCPRVAPDAFAPDAHPRRLEALWQTPGGWPAPDAGVGYARLPNLTDAASLGLAEFAVCPADLPAACFPGLTPAARPVAGPSALDAGALASDADDWTEVPVIPAGFDGVRYLLDFGRETIGFADLEIDAPEGALVDLSFFEMIQHDDRRNLTEGMRNTLRYVAREGFQRYQSVQRRGGRYVYVTFRGHDRPVKVRRVGIVESLYPQNRRGRFACDDIRLTRIWETAAHSIACCSEDTYTDCPTYEQTHWVGDARNEAMVDLIANGDPRLSRRCWLLTARSLAFGARDDFTNNQTPSSWTSIIPAWTFLWMRWGEEHWRMTGDDAFGREALEGLARQVDGLKRHLDERGLFFFAGWNMFDWAPMDTPSRGVVTHQNFQAVQALRQIAPMADALGRPDLARVWRDTAAGLAEAIDRHLWDGERNAYIDSIHADGRRSTVFSQQTHTAALLAELPDAARRARCRELLDDPPADFVRAGSPFFMFFFLEILAREGRFDDMLALISRYWGVQIEAGATTFWETCDPDASRLSEKRFTRSHCHGWSAAPGFFLSRYVLGVHPAAPGYRALTLAPRGGLTWCSGAVPTPAGLVEVYWERVGDGLWIDARLPAEGMAVTFDWGRSMRVELVDGGASEGMVEDGGRRLRFAAAPSRLRLRAFPE